jgi:chitinase
VEEVRAANPLPELLVIQPSAINSHGHRWNLYNDSELTALTVSSSLISTALRLLTLFLVDWEHPENQSQGQDYVHLLAALRQYLPAPQYTLSSALPAGEWALQHINLHQASYYLDMINLMAYDYSGPWVNKCGHQAQLFTPHSPHSPEAAISCHSAVSYMQRQGVPANKIIMGVPAYGRSFTGTRGVGHSFSGQAGEEGTFEYKDLPRPGAEEHIDEHVGAAYCMGGDGGFVTYDNPHTVRMKANYVRQNGLGGLFYWTGTGDASSIDNKDRSLVWNGFLGLFPQ